MFPTYNLENGKLIYESYNNELNESEQTKGALQNRLIELYKSVLLNENVIGEVMTPVDFDHFKKDIRSIIKEKSTTNLSTFNQLDDIDTRYSFSAGKSLVGQEANALTDYVLGSLANANGNNFKITNFNVPKSNEKLDMEYSQKLSDDDLKYYAKQLKLSTEQVEKLKSIKISHSLSAILNAAVDIAKDPYVTDGNWGTMTTNTGNLLLRKGVHPFYVNALLAQPIIKEYVEFASSYEASENQGLSTADEFIKQKFGEKSYNKRNNSNVLSESLETLRTEIGQRNKPFQMNVFATFLKYQAASKAIKANIDASKFMVDGIGGGVMSLIMAKNRVDAILEAERRYYELDDDGRKNFKEHIILGFKSKFTNPNGSESMFSKYYTNIILKPLEIVKANPKQFLVANDTIQNTFNEISIDVKNELLIDTTLGESNLGKQLDKTFYSYIMSGFDSLSITSQEREYLTLNFPKEFEAFKEANKDKYAIVDEITVKQGNTLEFIGLNNRKKSQDYEKLLVGSFLDLLNKDEEFANKLIKYSYLVSGFNNNKSQFFSMIPTQWFNRNNINRYILDKSAEYNTNYVDSNDDNFIDQYYLANLENKKLVKNVSQGQVLKGSGSIHGFVLDKPGKAGYFRVKSDPMGQNPDVYYKLIGYDVEYRGVYSRFIPNINDTLSEIKPLNVKDKKGNRIINYDTKGINLKPVTETSPGLANQIDKKVLSKLHDSAIYRRDKFYRENVIIKKDEVVNVDEVVTEDNEVATVAKSEVVNNMNELTNHSGGAKGGDMIWDSVGKEFGVTDHNHYTTKYFDNLSPEQQSELSKQYLQTVKWLGRGVVNSETYAGKLVRRDMIQANNSDAIFGVTELVKPGINGRKGYNNKTNHSIPEGGTGYAVTRGILTNKPTFVFNQSDNYGNEIGWYKWDNKSNDFVKVETPILTKNYAGIGSQEINELGIQAIKDVYEKTKNSLSEIKNSNKPQQLSLFDNSAELWNSNKTLLENNGMNEESFNQMYNEFGEDFINEYIKKCKS